MTEESKIRANYAVEPWTLVRGITHIGIKKGEVIPFKDLLSAMLVVSAGDASNVAAEFAGGTISSFMEGLNDYIKQIGCSKSRFENPSGVFHPNQQTCAHDMALIMREALQEPVLVEILGKSTYVRPKTNKEPSSTFVTNNRLMRPGPYYYPKAIGGKTGYLAASQNTLVMAARWATGR